MRRKSFQKMHCPIARSLERVGEWWSILILRDALHGLKRFDEFEQSLGISPTMLTRRLAGLVKAGLLERRRYNERPRENAREIWLLSEGAITLILVHRDRSYAAAAAEAAKKLIQYKASPKKVWRSRPSTGKRA